MSGLFIFGEEDRDWDKDYADLQTRSVHRGDSTVTYINPPGIFRMLTKETSSESVIEFFAQVAMEKPTSNVSLAAQGLCFRLRDIPFSVAVSKGSLAPFFKGLSGRALQATEDALSGNQDLALRFLHFICREHHLSHHSPLRFWGATASSGTLGANEHALIVLAAPTNNLRPSVEEARRLVAKAVHLTHAVDMMRSHLGILDTTNALVRFVDSQHSHGFLPPSGDLKEAYLSIQETGFETKPDRLGFLFTKVPSIVVTCFLPVAILPSIVRFLQQALRTLSQADGIKLDAMLPLAFLVDPATRLHTVLNGLDETRSTARQIMNRFTNTNLVELREKAKSLDRYLVTFIEETSAEDPSPTRFKLRQFLFESLQPAALFLETHSDLAPGCLVTPYCSLTTDDVLLTPLDVNGGSGPSRIVVTSALPKICNKQKRYFNEDKKTFGCILDTGSNTNILLEPAF